MVFSYTQIAQYLSCPRRYRYRYLDGWQERENRASMLFGRAFEQALAAYFLRDDCTAVLFEEWSKVRNLADVEYGRSESWDGMWREGVELLQRFARDDRVRIPQPERNLQVKVLRRIDATNDFVAYIDAVGELDGQPCLLDWKTSASCYPTDPAGLPSLDPQLICYSWMTGIADVAFVVFVRKRIPEIQYFRATISDKQRQDFGELVCETVRQIEAAHFVPHSGIRFPQNQCLSCAFTGLCLGQDELVARRLNRREGVDLGWLDELCA